MTLRLRPAYAPAVTALQQVISFDDWSEKAIPEL